MIHHRTRGLCCICWRSAGGTRWVACRRHYGSSRVPWLRKVSLRPSHAPKVRPLILISKVLTGDPLEYHPGKQATHPQQEGSLGGSEAITASLDLRET